MAIRYDPWAPEVQADPYPFYDELRSAGGCVHVPSRGIWAVGRHEDVVDVLRDPGTFTSREHVRRTPAPAPSGWIGEDPPTHTATRGLAQPVLSKAGVRTHVPAIDAAITTLVDEFAAAGGGDVVGGLANRVAVASVCRILGVPEAVDEMIAMGEETFEHISAFDHVDSDAPTAAQMAVGVPISGVIEQAKADGAGAATMVEAVIARAGDHVGLTKMDGIGRATYVTSLVGPGVETTRTMITHAVDLAARFPDEWRRLRDGAVTPEQFVDEVLRYETPIQGFFRGTVGPTEFAGESLPGGARVLCLFGSANRDPRAFDGADEFTPGRPEVGRHLAYGFGIHRCIGAWLAQAEGVATVRALADRVAEFSVADRRRQPDMALLRSFRGLDVELTRA